jgi:hypothetical protein
VLSSSHAIALPINTFPLLAARFGGVDSPWRTDDEELWAHEAGLFIHDPWRKQETDIVFLEASGWPSAAQSSLDLRWRDTDSWSSQRGPARPRPDCP